MIDNNPKLLKHSIAFCRDLGYTRPGSQGVSANSIFLYTQVIYFTNALKCSHPIRRTRLTKMTFYPRVVIYHYIIMNLWSGLLLCPLHTHTKTVRLICRVPQFSYLVIFIFLLEIDKPVVRPDRLVKLAHIHRKLRKKGTM